MNRPLQADDATVLEFADRLYERAEEGEGWNDSLRELADTIGGEFVALHEFDVRALRGTAVEILRGPTFDEFVPIYMQHSGNNIWMNSLANRPLPRPGQVISSHRLYPESELVKHSYYNDFLKDYGLFASVGAIVDFRNHRLTTVTILRGKKPGAFTEDQETYLKRVAPHLRNTFRVEQQLGVSKASRDLLCEILESLPIAVLALDSDHRVVLANQSAERLITARDGVKIAGGRLELDDRAAARTLRQLVGDLDRMKLGVGSATGGTFPIGRPSCSRPYLATAMPMRPFVSADMTTSSCCLLLVDDPEAQQQPP